MRHRRGTLLAMLSALALMAWAQPGLAQTRAGPSLTVFAAASLTNAMQDIGKAYTASTGVPVKFSFASSSVIARQLEAGADADLFLSADLEWMDYVQARGLIDPATRRNVLRGRLVLIAPAASTVSLRAAPGFPLLQALGPRGRLATGDPDYVPVGRYARSALTNLGVWNEVADRVVRADNVRVAMTYVARGEAPLGIVYETDAKVEPKVRIVDAFPASSHPAIVYPMAITRQAGSGARAFYDYVRGPTARAVFQKYGFVVSP